MTPTQAAKAILGRQQIRRNLLAWCEHALAPFDQTPAKHHRLLLKHLGDVAEGKCDRLIVMMPPGSAKSTYSTVLFPCWWFTQHPRGQIISASYNGDKANEFSGLVLKFIRENAKALGYSLERERMESWDISTGGTYRAVGMGGPVTGRRADLIIIDDPVKGIEEADSETIREKTGLWFNQDLYTRLKPGGAIIICQTRWHMDDLAGRLLKGMKEGKDQWRVVNLPAIAEGEDELGRKPGEPLWPELQPLSALARIRVQMGERGWSALYQQRPTAQEGSILRTGWWRPWTASLPIPDMTLLSLDLAYTEKEANDLSACTVWDIFSGAGPSAEVAQANGDFRPKPEQPDFRSKALLRFAWADRLEFPDLIEGLLETARSYKRPSVPMRVLIEAKGPGLSVVQELRRRVPSLNVFAVNPKGSKVARAHAVTAMFEAGVVHAVAELDDDDKPKFKPFVQMVIDECAAFPVGLHDDLADSVTQAIRHLRDLGLEMFSEDEGPSPVWQEPAPFY